MLPNFARAAAGALLLLSVVTSAAQAAPHRDKVDRAVRAALASGASAQNVIITVNPGCRAGRP